MYYSIILFLKILIKALREELLHSLINVVAVVGDAVRNLKAEYMV